MENMMQGRVETAKPSTQCLSKVFSKPVEWGISNQAEKSSRNNAECEQSETRASEEKHVHQHADMGDLAGVRVGLFFPGDVERVRKALLQNFEEKHSFGSVTGTTRYSHTGRNRDISRHAEGRWTSHDASNGVQHWEHYGYKSWQMVVEWKEEDLRAIKADLVPITFFGTPKAEIQLGTVVSQAWTEVQHNIIYKNPDGLLYGSTPTMTRILDAINGLAITTDIMLVELEQNMEKAAREAKNTQSLRMEYDRLAKEKHMLGFINSASNGDLPELEDHLRRGMNVNARGPGGVTALHMASRNGQYQAVKRLLSHPRTDVDLRTDLGDTPLFVACLRGHIRVAELLLTNLVVAKSSGSNGRTALHVASSTGDVEMVNLLLSNKSKIDVNARDERGETALFMPCRIGYAAIVELLLAAGIDTNARNSEGRTVLHAAGMTRHTGVVELLLSKSRRGGLDVNALDKDDRTALYYAVVNGDYEIVEKFLEGEGIDISTQCGKEGYPVLHIAVIYRHPTVLKQLLSKGGADPNVIGREQRITALHVAAIVGLEEEVECLLSAGKIDVGIRGWGRITAHQLASAAGFTRIAAMIEEASHGGQGEE